MENKGKKQNFIVSSVMGLTAPLRGFIFIIKNPRLIKFTVFPIIINIILILTTYIFGSRYLIGLVDRWIPDEEAWYWAILFWIAVVVLVLAVSLVAAVLFYIIAGIVCVPFNELLSQEVEAMLRERPHQEDFSVRLLALDIWLALVGEVKRIFLYLSLIIPLLLLNLIPVLGTVIYGVIFGVVTLLFLAFDFVDHPLGRRRIPFREKRKFMIKHFFSMIGFGAGVFVFLLVPIVNFIVLPLNAIGGTILFSEIEHRYGEIEYRGTTPKKKKGN